MTFSAKDMTMEENGPGITVPADVSYIVTYERTK